MPNLGEACPARVRTARNSVEVASRPQYAPVVWCLGGPTYPLRAGSTAVDTDVVAILFLNVEQLKDHDQSPVREYSKAAVGITLALVSGSTSQSFDMSGYVAVSVARYR